MDKLITVGAGFFMIFVPGPALLGGFYQRGMARASQFLAYIFWFFVAVGAAAGMIVLVRKLLALKEEEAPSAAGNGSRAQEEIQKSFAASARNWKPYIFRCAMPTTTSLTVSNEDRSHLLVHNFLPF